MTELLTRVKAALAERYAVERRLGAGGMATVYLAEDLKHQRKVAVKVLRPEIAASLGPERFVREIGIAARLHHPHILSLYDSGEIGGLLFYVMPYVEGESLRDRLNREKQLPLDDALRIAREVADALSYAHSHDVVHRDIKPENIMLESGHAMVADFGIARAISAASGTSITQTGLVVGTPAYMSPEQAAGTEDLDGRTDLYSLGCVLYEMVAGQPPFSGPTADSVVRQHMAVEPPPITNLRPGVPGPVVGALARALSKTPADRFSPAAQFAEALAWSRTTTETVVQWTDPWRVVGLFAVSALAVMGVVYFLMIQLGLPGWVLPGAAALLGLGLPIMLITSHAEKRRVRARQIGSGEFASLSSLHRWLTWRRAAAGGVLAFAGLGMVTAVYVAMRLGGIGPVGTLMATGVLEDQARLIVADFENRTDDSLLGTAVTEALRIDMAQSSAVSVLDEVAVVDALSRMGRAPGSRLDLPLAREVAQREGAKAVIVGEITRLGQGYTFAARILPVADGPQLIALRETARDDGEIIDALDRLSRKLRERIGESLRSLRSTEPLARVTTASLDALRAYSLAVRYWAAGEVERPIALLESAIASDTAFAMAYRKLAAILYDNDISPSQMIDASTKAFQHRDRLPEVEGHLATAWYYDIVEGDRANVIASYRALLERDPNNGIALINLGDALMAMRRSAEAESAAEQAIAVSGLPVAYFNAIEAEVALGKFAEARAHHTDLSALEPAHPDIPWLGALLSGSQRDYVLGDQYLDSLARTQPASLSWQRTVLELRFAFAAVQGKLMKAREAAAQLTANAKQEGHGGRTILTAIDAARLDLVYRGSTDGSARIEQALLDQPLDSLPPLDRPYLALAEWHAQVGKVAEAKRLLQEYRTRVDDRLQRNDPLRHGVIAGIALAEKRYEDAAAGFRTYHEESRCAVCGLYELGHAYELAGERDSAIATYERAVGTPGLYRASEERFTLPQTLLRLGDLYETRDPDKAVAYLSRVVELWQEADDVLQPEVAGLTERIARLGAR